MILIELTGPWPLVPEECKIVHEQGTAEEVDLLTKTAEAMGPAKEQRVLKVAVDRLGVGPARVDPGEAPNDAFGSRSRLVGPALRSKGTPQTGPSLLPNTRSATHSP